LKIYNRYYFFIYHKRYIDITPLFSSATWPRLSYLTLSDLTIDDKVATRFLAAHHGLREISVSLSLDKAVDGQPKVPFNIDKDFLTTLLGDNSNKEDDTRATVKGAGTGRAFLSNLEILAVHPQLARSILHAITQHHPSSSFSHCLRSIGTIEPRDWGSVPEIESDYAGERLLMYDSETPPPQTSASDADGTDEDINLFEKLTKVRSLVVRNIRSLSQLDSLVTATGPRLESLCVETRRFIPGLVSFNFCR